MGTAEIIIFLLLMTCLLALLAQRGNIPYSSAFLLGGVALGFVPSVRDLELAPESMLMIFLPPLLMEAAYFTSLRDFRDNLRPILKLAIGLVFITAVIIAAVFVHIVPEATWAMGFVLGAIISPPDVVAATSVIKKMRIPKRITTILEGESLVNDAMGLVMYKFAVAAVLTGYFSFPQASTQFVMMAVIGVGVGLAVGYLFIRFFRHIKEIPIEILSSIMIPYLSYFLAEHVHGSGVLAVVATGLYVSWHSPTTFTAKFRIPAEAVWHMLSFVLSAFVFILIGMQIPSLLERVSIYSPSALAEDAAIICGAVVLVRFVYVFAVGYGTRFLFPAIRKNDPYPPWQNTFLIGYVGMRGVVSLATALALPVAMWDGTPFPHRDLILFLALSVIVFTLVVQGLSLPWLLRRLTLTYEGKILYEDWFARVSAARMALEKIEDLQATGKAHAPALMRIKSHYEERLESLGDGPNT
ncbi:MAG: Na+/H+ antiporter [Alphaproteobacteria bacterium]|nr:Na+/H+ antiporter [Alphaproteobacteria bacterium]